MKDKKKIKPAKVEGFIKKSLAVIASIISVLVLRKVK
jgi:hypothetical protein